MDKLTDQERLDKFEGFLVSQITKHGDDLCWAIEVAFDKAPALMEELANLADEFGMEDILALGPIGKLIIDEMAAKWDERLEAKADKKWEKVARQLANRGLYLDKVDVEATVRGDMTVKYRFKLGLDSAGLMARYLEHQGALTGQPVVMNLLNRLPKVKNEKGQDTAVQHEVPTSEAELFYQHGYLLCGLKTLWNKELPELWEVMHRCLPRAIDFGSYHRRLRAPLVPGGFLPEHTVRIQTVKAQGRIQGADGAGTYDPEHPAMAELVGRYGPVAMQFTAFNPETGHFFKGIIVPREGVNCGLKPEQVAGIQFDHLQVKGSRKNEHKALRKANGVVMLDGVYIGVMKAKTQMGRVSGCFEVLENIGPDATRYKLGELDPRYRVDKARVAMLIAELTRECIDEVGELGPSGLLGRACRDDQYLRRLGEFIAMANQEGADINPLDIPILASKVQESLSRRLWAPTNGAGINGKYPMVVIDDTLKPGTCVISGYKPGSEIACWRFPTILAQALRVLKVVHGREHHQVEERTIKNVIFMNSFDIVVCQQGDDDGDEVGVSSDPRIIELFGHRKDNRVFHIEPSSEKLEYATDSDEGREYIQGDPMGPVGLITIWKAALAALGRDAYELAFAVLIQEAIDSQKNLVRMTCPHKAAKLENWYKHPVTGHYHIHYKCPETGEWLTDNWLSSEAGEFDIDVVKEAYENEVMAAGCIKVIKTADGTKVIPGWPLGWRTQHKLAEKNGEQVKVKLRKAVALNNWLSWREKQDGARSNWVHLAHDVAMNCWNKWHNSFTSKGELPTKDVLLRILENLGVPLRPQMLPWDQYLQGLRTTSGLVRYGQEMKKLRAQASQRDGNAASPLDEQARLARIDNLRAELDIRMSGLSAQQLLTIWCMELQSTWWYNDRGRKYVTDRSEIPQGVRSWRANTPNYAFAAVTSKHSAIMKLLGFTTTEACDWLQDEGRINRLVGWARRQDNPYLALTKLVRSNTAHGEQHHDEDGHPVHLGDCPECMERLNTSLVRSIRSDKTAKEQRVAKDLISSMNSQQHEPLPNVQPSDYADDSYEWSPEPMSEEYA